MMYTEKDVNEAVKVLFFEGAGCVERGDVENCRIRTAFTNDEGEKIYLELWGVEVTPKHTERYRYFRNAAIIDYCYIVTEDGEKYLFDIERKLFEYSKFDIERKLFEYSKAEILKFVNENLKCSFNSIKICDDFDGYRVHKDGGGYNFIDDFVFNEEKANATRKAYNDFDRRMREKLNSKYSKVSLLEITEDGFIARCYASDEEMRKNGLDPNQRKFQITLKGEYQC